MGNLEPNMSVEIAGIKLRNPVVLASGPTSRNGECLKKAALCGAGAVTTKTIYYDAAKVPRPCIAKLSEGLLNNEKWSDIGYKKWVEEEIPKAKEGGVPLIASIKSLKNKPEEITQIAQGTIEAGADMVEVVATYSIKPLPNLIKAAKKATDAPVIAKVALENFDIKKFGKKLERAGADAISCMDTVGPCLTIDIKTGQPILGGQGIGRLSGPAIKPLSVYQVSSLAQTISVPVIGIGGVMCGRDAIEMMMAGATAVGICTMTIIKGPEIIKDISREIALFMKDNGYRDITEFIGLALKKLEERKRKGFMTYEGKPPKVIEERCIRCAACVRACPYDAITLNDVIHINEKLCYGCGLCYTVCSTETLTSPY